MAGIYDYQSQQVKDRAQQQTSQNNDAMNRRMAAMGGGPSGAAEKLQLQGQNQVQQNSENAIAGINANQQQEQAGINRENAGREFQAGQAKQSRDLEDQHFGAQLGFQQNQATAQNALSQKNLDLQQRGQDIQQQNFDKQLALKKQEQDEDNNFFSGKNLGGLARGALGAGIGALFSDKDKKTQIVPADKYMGDFLDEVKPVEYEYKDMKNGLGKQYGVIAQDLEKHPVGASLVISGSQGKMVNTDKASTVNMAALSSLHRRLKQLESEDS